MEAVLFWIFWGLCLPALIGLAAYVGMLLHERSLKR
jgi:hypothetical protein